MGSRCWHVWSGGGLVSGPGGGQGPHTLNLAEQMGLSGGGYGAPAGACFRVHLWGAPLTGRGEGQAGPGGLRTHWAVNPITVEGGDSAETVQRLKIGGGSAAAPGATWLPTGR